MSTLSELFKHNTWANLRLIDACEAADDVLDASAPGTRGAALETLVHLLAAEERYVAWLSGEPQPDPPLRERDAFPGFARLRERANHSGDALVAIATSRTGDDWLYGEGDGIRFRTRTLVPLVQAIQHANEHRTHVTTILSQQGVEPPDLSGWAYSDEMGYEEVVEEK